MRRHAGDRKLPHQTVPVDTYTTPWYLPPIQQAPLGLLACEIRRRNEGNVRLKHYSRGEQLIRKLFSVPTKVNLVDGQIATIGERRRRSRLCRRRTPIILAIPLIAMLAFATLIPATPSSAGTRTVAQYGGNLTVGEYLGMTTLDPAHITGGIDGGSEGAAIYGELMRLNVTTGTYVPYLAQSLTHSSNDMQWTLTLRPHMQFTDGTPFTASAVIENLQRYEDPSVASGGAPLLYGFVASMQAVNPLTVDFTLKQPWPGFAALLSGADGWVAAPSYIKELEAGDATATPIGAGPFIVSSFQPNVKLTLKPNPTFVLGKPYLKTLTFTYIPGGQATLQAFQDNELNGAFLYDPATIRTAKTAGIKGVTSVVDVGQNILMNNRPGSIMSNQKLRQAVAMAINPQRFNTEINQGAAKASSLVFAKGSQWYNPQAKPLPYDPAKAKQMVQQIKAQTGWNGTIPFICSNEPGQSNIATSIESMLTPVGIKLSVTDDIPENDVIDSVVIKKDFALACWGYAIPDSNPFQYLWQQLDSASVVNFAGYSNPAMNAVINSARVAKSRAQEKAALGKIQQIWNQDPPSAALNQIDETFIYSSHVHGVRPTQEGMMLFDKTWLS